MASRNIVVLTEIHAVFSMFRMQATLDSLSTMTKASSLHTVVTWCCP